MVRRMRRSVGEPQEPGLGLVTDPVQGGIRQGSGHIFALQGFCAVLYPVPGEVVVYTAAQHAIKGGDAEERRIIGQERLRQVPFADQGVAVGVVGLGRKVFKHGIVFILKVARHSQDTIFDAVLCTHNGRPGRGTDGRCRRVGEGDARCAEAVQGRGDGLQVSIVVAVQGVYAEVIGYD